MAKHRRTLEYPVSKIDRELLNAVQELDYGKVQTALDNGADPNCLDEKGTHIIWSAIDIFSEYQDKFDRRQYKVKRENAEAILSLLLSYGSDPDGGIAASDTKHSTPLMVVCYYLEIRIAKLFLQYGADVNHVDDGHTWLDHLYDENMFMEFRRDDDNEDKDELDDRQRRLDRMFALAEAHGAEYFENLNQNEKE